MKESLYKQLLGRLNLKETEELLEIWRNHDANEWIDEVFEVVEEILMERLGELPVLSTEPQDAPELEEEAPQGDEGQPAEQISDRVIRPVEPQAVLYIEEEQSTEEAVPLPDELAELSLMEQLDEAYWYACDEKPEKALLVCKAVKPSMPDDAEARNYLGIIYDTLGQVELALEAYLTAAHLDPDFSAARKNLRNARVRREGEEYHRAANLTAEETEALCLHVDQADEADFIESGEPIPGWYYLDETAYLLSGWPGYRTRPGRSGYDPLDSDFELAHIQGVLIHRLFTRTLRTRNSVYLIFMTFLGCMFCIPLLFGLMVLIDGDFQSISLMVLFTPYWVVGIALLVNVALSRQLEESDTEENDVFF
jgi:tetratricopeptide (TPR) repeat protein